MKSYHVYIAASISKRLYVGVTGNIEKRANEHRLSLLPGFTRRYQIKKMVYVEEGCEAVGAIQREKTIKGWRRSKKIELIEKVNPDWQDLAITDSSSATPSRNDKAL